MPTSVSPINVAQLITPHLPNGGGGHQNYRGYHMTDNGETPQTTDMDASLVRGFQIHSAMGCAVLTLGIDAQGPNGETGIVPSPNYLIPEPICRQIAEALLVLANRLREQGGSV